MENGSPARRALLSEQIGVHGQPTWRRSVEDTSISTASAGRRRSSSVYQMHFGREQQGALQPDLMYLDGRHNPSKYLGRIVQSNLKGVIYSYPPHMRAHIQHLEVELA